MSLQAIEFVNTEGVRHFVGLTSIFVVVEVTDRMAEEYEEKYPGTKCGKTWVDCSCGRIDVDQTYEEVVQKLRDVGNLQEREQADYVTRAQQSLADAFRDALRGARDA